MTPIKLVQKWSASERRERANAQEHLADLWKRGHFAWEWKGKNAGLAAAYRQLLQDSLRNNFPTW